MNGQLVVRFRNLDGITVLSRYSYNFYAVLFRGSTGAQHRKYDATSNNADLDFFIRFLLIISVVRIRVSNG